MKYFFNFFNKLTSFNYSFQNFKEFSENLIKMLDIKKKKKLVKVAYSTYIKGLKQYEKVLDYAIEATKDVDRCNIIDKEGKELFKTTINKEFSQSFIDAKYLKRIKETDLILSINKKSKVLSNWTYKD